MRLDNSFFLKTKTHTVLTWQAKIIILIVGIGLFRLCWPAIRSGITNYICAGDELKSTSRIILENWDGNIDLFEGAKLIADSLGEKEIVSIIYEDSYSDFRKRRAYILNAWAVGIDTSHFLLLPVPKRDPKTLNIARTVTDTAQRRQWLRLSIVTADLHSARSRKAYQFTSQPYGISVQIAGVPIEGVTHANWHRTSTGIAMAFSELIKKIYYDVFVF
jgi:hypothetical protein